jgi:hypothetical protein
MSDPIDDDSSHKQDPRHKPVHDQPADQAERTRRQLRVHAKPVGECALSQSGSLRCVASDEQTVARLGLRNTRALLAGHLVPSFQPKNHP